MYTFIGLFIVVFTIFFIKTKDSGFTTLFGRLIFTTFSTSSSSLLFMLVLSAIVSCNDSCVEEYLTFTDPIVSISSDKELKGSFFLGSGTISNSEYYYTYRVTGKNMFKKEYFSVSKTEILESDLEPEMQVYEERIVAAWKPFVFDMADRQTYILRVPHGTIIKEFQKLK